MARRSILLLAAVLIAALGTGMIILYVQGIDSRATKDQDLVEVLSAKELIGSGESVEAAQEAGKFDLVQVRRADLVDGALSETASLEGMLALGDIYPGEQIISQKFGASGAESQLTIPEDKLAISVELTDPERVAGFVNPGSRVAIFVSADPELFRPDGSTQKLPQYTGLLLGDVQVIGVGTTSSTSRTTTTDEGEQTTEEVPRTILTVAVTQAEAEKVIFAARNGDLSFALRSDESAVAAKNGVTANDIMPGAFKAVG